MSAAREHFARQWRGLQGRARRFWRFIRGQEAREECVQETLVLALDYWLRAERKGRAVGAFLWHVLDWACRHVRAGRRNYYASGRSDAWKGGLPGCRPSRVQSGGGTASAGQCYPVEELADSPGEDPAMIAAFRIDFAAFLAVLPERNARMAAALGEGQTPAEVASLLEIPRDRVVKVRGYLRHLWEMFTE